MRKLVVSEFLQEEFLGVLRGGHEVVYDPDLYADRQRLLEEVAGAEAIFVRNRTYVDAEFVAAANRMKAIDGGISGPMVAAPAMSEAA